jgi:hypothetical protein
MKKSKRIVILLVVVEALLAAIMIFLTLQVRLGALQSSSPDETIGRIGSSIGGIMGALGGFLLVFAWVLRRRGE